VKKSLVFPLEKLNLIYDVRLHQFGGKVTVQTLQIGMQLQRPVLGERNVADQFGHSPAFPVRAFPAPVSGFQRPRPALRPADRLIPGYYTALRTIFKR
jgi:hypothetical protein